MHTTGGRVAPAQVMQAQASANTSAPGLDLTGVWTTPGDQPNLFIQTDVQDGSGMAQWLRSPPQTMRLFSQGGNGWLAVSLDGETYAVSASSSNASSGMMADTLVVGTGATAVTWTRNTTGEAAWWLAVSETGNVSCPDANRSHFPLTSQFTPPPPSIWFVPMTRWTPFRPCLG
jgi:hypothetical protein